MKKQFSDNFKKIKEAMKPYADKISMLLFDEDTDAEKPVSSVKKTVEPKTIEVVRRSNEAKTIVYPRDPSKKLGHTGITDRSPVKPPSAELYTNGNENASARAEENVSADDSTIIFGGSDEFSLPLTANTPIIDRSADSIRSMCSRLTDTGKMLSCAVSVSGVFKAISSQLEDYDRGIREVCSKIIAQSEADPSARYLGYDLAHSVFDLFNCSIHGYVLPKLRQMRKEGVPDAEKLVMSINSYLSSVGFFTPAGIIPGVRYDNKLSSCMECSAYYCNISGNNGIVKDIENLPYIIRYVDTRGVRQELVALGRANVYKYIEG